MRNSLLLEEYFLLWSNLTPISHPYWLYSIHHSLCYKGTDTGKKTINFLSILVEFSIFASKIQ